MSIYDISIRNMDGDIVSMDTYRGKVLLVVNTATECGFTPQYENLQDLYEKYHDAGLEILDFPCNQFGHQAPGSNDEIAKFCSARFGITFPQFAKIDVNGANESELFTYLKAAQPFAGFDTTNPIGAKMDAMLRANDPDYDKKSDIKWNFTKFVVTRDGDVIRRFEPMDDIGIIEMEIAKLLG